MNFKEPASWETAARTLFVLLAILFWVWELKRPIRKVRYGREIVLSLVGVVVAGTLDPVITHWVKARLISFQELRPNLGLNPVVATVLCFVCADLSRYFTHRLMHTSYLWPTHRFHHSPTELHWLSGNRASPFHAFLSFGPTAFFAWFFSLGVVEFGATALVGVLWNYMMHVNVRLSDRLQRFLEYLVTTPRYHHIHHADAAELAGKNLASVFTFPDRLFGTYVSPDRVDAASLRFGLADEKLNPIRLIIGL
ncbi:MAG TPA: sterol desaturase family protein [Vicinamibacterales bacterium]|jgi:sterol desaturase/sphingolipid hydroxylase (fatty acid hydroxylase superfamily)|nr:sterol desaturase family protein [Vicinamibacterales bacterium]